MNDIQKLHQVIGELEEQASNVSEFNGVLTSVNEARKSISACNDELRDITEEHRALISSNSQYFHEFASKLSEMQEKLIDLGLSQDQAVKITTDQFESVRDKVLVKLSELNVVTPEQFEQGRISSENKLLARIDEMESTITGLADRQRKSVRFLWFMLILGVASTVGTVLIAAKYGFL